MKKLFCLIVFFNLNAMAPRFEKLTPIEKIGSKCSQEIIDEPTRQLIISIVHKDPIHPETFSREDFEDLNRFLFVPRLYYHLVGVRSKVNDETISSILNFLLYLKKFDVNLRWFYGRNLLASSVSPYIVSILIKNKIFDINSEDDDKNTPLMLASVVGNLKKMELLIHAGAKIDSQNKKGKNALMLASIANRNASPSVELLIGSKANLDAVDEEGNTALILAIKNNQSVAAKELINAGARINIADEEGKTAFDYAQEKNNKVIIDLLESKGAKSGRA